jgi:hypothetical protein
MRLARSMVVGVAIGSGSLAVVAKIMVVLPSVVWNDRITRIVCRREGRGQERSMRWGLEHVRWYITRYGIGRSCRGRSNLSGLRRTAWRSRHCVYETILLGLDEGLRAQGSISSRQIVLQNRMVRLKY